MTDTQLCDMAGHQCQRVSDGQRECDVPLYRRLGAIASADARVMVERRVEDLVEESRSYLHDIVDRAVWEMGHGAYL